MQLLEHFRIQLGTFQYILALTDDNQKRIIFEKKTKELEQERNKRK